MILTVIFLISHTIADFVLQTDNIVKMKKAMNIKGYYYHGLGLLLTMLPVLIVTKTSFLLKVSWKILFLVFIHIFIDVMKEKIQIQLENNNGFVSKNIVLFASDQLMHIIIIILITNSTVFEFNGFSNILLRIFMNGNPITYSFMAKAFIVLYISFSGAYAIPCILDIIYAKVENYADELNRISGNQEASDFDEKVKTGKWIGILERFLIVIFLSLNQLSLIGFIIAVKSLCRFKLMENKHFSEYYLIGTMISLVYTLVLYISLNKMFL